MKTLKTKFPYSILILILGITLGFQIQKAFSSDNLRDSLLKFNDVLSYTDKYYVEDVDTHKLVEAAINGMLTKLDPHSVYIPAKQLENVEESFRGDFDGIGIEYQVVNDTLTVVSPITGGPSEALGIMSGDRIIKIDDKGIIGISNDDVRNKLRGAAGTKVKVTIIRPGITAPQEYYITRGKIPIYSVDTHFMINEKTGYISVSRFSETTYDEVVKALNDLKEKGMKQIIFDLRGNPGGYMEQAVKISDLFLDGKKKIVYTKGRRSEFDQSYYAGESSTFENIPLIVLVNKGSASASEIVSGAIQDWDRGLIVGETTFGKGLVQRQFTLSDNSALRLTISRYFTPSGRLIQRDYKKIKDKDEYYSEAGNDSAKEGDNLNHGAESDSGRPVFKTNGGRIVYGGGGITPDYIIKSEDITDYTTELLKNNIFYLYVLKYLDEYSSGIKAKYGNDFPRFLKEYTIGSDVVNSFTNFATEKKVKLHEEDVKKDYKYIAARIKAQIARNFWKNEGWYPVILLTDNQFAKALTLFGEAKLLAKLK
jgi:carboxyl-terminal processing protease